jgi:hypothetical protein
MSWRVTPAGGYPAQAAADDSARPAASPHYCDNARPIASIDRNLLNGDEMLPGRFDLDQLPWNRFH